MSLLVTRVRESDSLKQENACIPPLFAGPLRDDLLSRISAALCAGDDEKATVLLQEADSVFPGDSVFPALHLSCLKLAQRKARLEVALAEASNELSEDHFVTSFGKFRETLSLSRGHRILEERTYESFITAAYTVLGSHWRFAETLLHELAGLIAEPVVPSALWASIERQKRDESIRVALDESGRAEHTEHLPHLRARLAELAKAYPKDENLEARLRALDELLVRRSGDEREKNFRRLTDFRDRLDASDNPQTLRRFRELVAPFADPYPGDPVFLSVIEEMRSLHLTYDHIAQLIAEDRLQEALQSCEQVLRQRPASVLFCALEEKAKAREWVIRLVTSATQRARAFEEKAQYAEALEEWESLRETDPSHPGLDSEILHCAALKQQAESLPPSEAAPPDETALIPEIVAVEPEQESLPMVVAWPQSTARAARVKIAMTQDAWNHFKTGLAATAALLLLALVFAANLH
jgi:tetratricopeptide (TPR) repeat protein